MQRLPKTPKISEKPYLQSLLVINLFSHVVGCVRIKRFSDSSRAKTGVKAKKKNRQIVFGGNSEGTSVVRPTSRPDFHAIRLRSFASAYTNACHASCTCCHLCLNKLDLTTDDGSNHFGMRSVVMKIVFFGNKEKKFKY